MKRNDWNLFIYRLWSPFYDWLVGRPLIVRERKKAIDALALESGEKLLLAGAGTGVDLPLLPGGIRVTGIDLSPAMLARAARKLPLPEKEVVLQAANAEELPFADGEFDAAALFLILSVAGDPRRVLGETLRVLRPGGRVVVFDKFLAAGRKAPLGRKILNALITRPFGTDINRSFEPLLAGLPGEMAGDEPSLFGGAYRIIRLTRVNRPPG